jgi:23S rRNA (guanosine2251-2'-O)-methyltransferase
MKITRYENAIFGLRPIIEAITAGQEIDTLFIQKGLKGDIFPELWELVKKPCKL